MKGTTLSIFAIVQSKTSSISAPYYGQTFEMTDITPIYIIVNINGQESTLSHRDVLIVDIENVLHAAKDLKDKKIFLCLKDYINVNQIKIEL